MLHQIEVVHIARHSLKYCMVCNMNTNGMSGTPGTEAIGRYHLPKEKSRGIYGWIPVCKLCALSLYRQGMIIIPLRGFESSDFFHMVLEDTESQAGGFQHNWEKMIMRGLDLTDIWKCTRCLRLWYCIGNEVSPPFMGCSISGGQDANQLVRCIKPKCRAILLSDRHALLKPFIQTPQGPVCCDCAGKMSDSGD